MSKVAKFLVFYYILILIWWIVFFFAGIKQNLAEYLYQFAFGLIPLIGGILGLLKAKAWVGLKIKVGRAVFFISCGLITW